MYDPSLGRWTTEDPIGFAGGDPNLYRYVGNDPTNKTDPTGEQAKTVQDFANKGIKAKETKDKDYAGPDVTKWFAYDLVVELKDRYDTRSANPKTDLEHFRDLAADRMSYKWIDFGYPKEDKGVNTVVLGDMVLAKKQLGNVAFLVVGTALPPSNFALDAATIGSFYKNFLGAVASKNKEMADKRLGVIANGKNLFEKNEGKPNTLSGSAVDKVALLGYSITPYHQGAYRSDNLAAFGVGRLITWKFLKELNANEDKARDILKQKLKEGDLGYLAERMEKVLRGLFVDTPAARAELEGAVNAFREFQPLDNPPKIGYDALFSTPDYGGYNFNSLSKRMVKEGDKDVVVRFNPIGENTISWANELRQYFNKKFPDKANDPEAFRKWREEELQKWTQQNGFRPKGVTYPPTPNDK